MSGEHFSRETSAARLALEPDVPSIRDLVLFIRSSTNGKFDYDRDDCVKAIHDALVSERTDAANRLCALHMRNACLVCTRDDSNGCRIRAAVLGVSAEMVREPPPRSS